MSAIPVATTPTHSGIYRWAEGKTVVYGDRPCPNGREVDVRVTSGFNAPPVPAARRQVSAENGPALVPIPDASAVEQPPSKAACTALEEAIARIDAAARAGGSVVYQDQLREQRHKLVDEKYRLRC